MQVKRINIYTGSILYKTRFSLCFEHHILFARDFEHKMGINLLSNEVYPTKTIKGKGYIIGGFIYPLEQILKYYGYPEMMNDPDITRLLTDDSKKIFVDSNILYNLDSYMDIEYNPILYNDSNNITKTFQKQKY